MKNGLSFLVGIGMSATFLLTTQSCTKSQATGRSSADSSASSTSTSTAIAVAVDSAGTDSVYIMQDCGHGNYRDSIAAGGLPAITTAYLDSSYSGYSLVKAYEIKDSQGTVKGYVVVIRYNGIPVGILFNADGSFDKVLEQREQDDMRGHGGYHSGGRYGNRDGHQRDTVALTSLPSAITSYFSSNYPADSLEKAYRNIDSSYLVISKDSVFYSTLFSSGGTFISRTEIHWHQSSFASVKAEALPAAATNYLTNTYPNFVFDKGYAFYMNGAVSGYLVFIDASNSKYAVEFDATGAFIGAITIF